MSRRRVLLVDDDVAVLQMLSLALTKAGYDVLQAQDALQGVTRAIRDSPDIVLLDLIMPGGGGFIVLERIKRSSKTRLIPIIIISGSVDPDVETRAQQLGVRDFFHKPYDLLELLARISSLLGNAAREG